VSVRSRAIAALVATTCLGLALAGTALAARPAWNAVGVTGPTVLSPIQGEIQSVAVDATGGTFSLSYEGAVTGPIAFNATAGAVEGALDGLTAIGGAGGSAHVVGGPGNLGGGFPYAITFDGTLANLNLPQIVADSSLLTAGSGGAAAASVSTRADGGPGTTELLLRAQNIGGLSSSGPITYKVTLPPGVTTVSTPTGGSPFLGGWACSPGVQTEFTCTYSGFFGTPAIGPSATPPPITATIAANPGAASGTIHMEVSDGGAEGAATGSMPLTISSSPAEPGIQAFSAGAYDSDGHLDTRAGAHPSSASAAIFVNTKRNARGKIVPVGEFRDIAVNLPPGFLGNPVAVPQCPASTEAKYCPADTIVGVVQPVTGFGEEGELTSVSNTQAPYGYPGEFRFTISDLEPLNVVGGFRSDGDYGITASSLNTPQISPVYGTFFTFWGLPADESHDAQRCVERPSSESEAGDEKVCGEASDATEIPFLTNATNCGEEAERAPVTDLNVTLWQNPGEEFHRTVGLPPVTGCENLHFDGSFALESSGSSADSPASFKTSVAVPAEGLTDPTKLTTPELRKTVIRFPQGVVLNASGANGLQACSEQQIGYLGGNFPMPNPMHFDKEPNTCPEASKVGSGELTTALLEEPLHGALYLAAQGEGNPFGSLLAVYLVIENPARGVFIKLPGEVEPDPQTGQLTATFDNLPQLPFTKLDLSLKGGATSALATPETCGNYTTHTTFTPWSAPESGPPLQTEDSFPIDSGPSGTPCANTSAQRPFSLGLTAGSQNATAGAHSPFSIQVRRPDGAQEVSSLDITTPVGFTATLKGVPYCTEAEIAAAGQSTGKAEQTSPACPGASQVGTTQVGAGSGPSPFYAPGKVYLAGPYKGAALSVVAITPAVAGPLDLGDVVVRSALFVNPETAQITAKTDPLPEFLKGVQLRIRDIRIDLDRPNWALNPTSCEPKAVEVNAKGNSGAVAKLSNGFQVGNCAALAFKPKLKLSLKGGTRRNRYPALTATLTQPEGQANISRVAATLPHSEFLEQGHIKTICTRVQFAAVPRACPAKSIYGHAEAESPLLGYKLSGPVYLRSSEHKLPDLVAALQGPASQPIEIDLDGRIDSVHGGIRSSFELVPDAPVSKFVLHIQGGKKGLLVNSTNLCTAKANARRATVRIIGQNNKRADQFPLLANQCGRHNKKPRHDNGTAKSKAHRENGKKNR
jgi:hypothetical protein